MEEDIILTYEGDESQLTDLPPVIPEEL